ncbi:MAG: HD domain-containing protein [Anaerolineae bacterium]|nr:HD domain-containing protein [Anaerolineae bacterium]
MWRRYEFIANTLRDFLTLINADYRYEAANRAYCAAHCRRPEEIIGKKVSEVWGEERFNLHVKPYLDQCFSGQETNYQGWFEFSTLGMRYMDVVYYPYRDTAGKVTHAVVISRDVTAFKLAQDEAQRQLQRLRVIHNFETKLITTIEVESIIQTLLDQAVSQLEAVAVNIWLYESDAQKLRHMAGRGFAVPPAERSVLHLGEGYPGRAALERQIVTMVRSPSEWFHAPQGLIYDRPIAYYGIPLLARDQLRGVLELFTHHSWKVDPEYLHFLDTLASQAAMALDNAQLFRDLQQAHQELIAAYDATLESWVRTLDLRDHETEGHTQRVANITVALARLMGIEEPALTHVRRGALLHDIGKIAIPDSILLKPGPLTEEEQRIMRKHPEYAYELLSRFAFLRPALDIPYCHHERWDGTGYPRGLKGEEIPLAARIFAVVDVWDALRSDRPYRAALSWEQAYTLIKGQTGTHFDPEVVRVFLEWLDRHACFS